MVSLNMGRMNFNIAGLADRYKGWRYYWEYPYLQATENMIFRNTSREIALILQRLGEGCGTLLEYMCYDIGHLHNRTISPIAAWLRSTSLCSQYSASCGGIGLDPHNVMFVKQTADRLFGRNYIWPVLDARRY